MGFDLEGLTWGHADLEPGVGWGTLGQARSSASQYSHNFLGFDLGTLGPGVGYGTWGQAPSSDSSKHSQPFSWGEMVAKIIFRYLQTFYTYIYIV